jgi:hypothetical protein
MINNQLSSPSVRNIEHLTLGGQFNYTHILKQEIHGETQVIVSNDSEDILETIKILNYTYRNWNGNL